MFCLVWHDQHQNGKQKIKAKNKQKTSKKSYKTDFNIQAYNCYGSTTHAFNNRIQVKKNYFRIQI